MRRTLGRIWSAALLTSLPYRLFLWHRTDYLGHTIAGFGGTLFLLSLPLLFQRRMSERKLLAIVVLAVAMGFGTEMTVFNLAKFDPVDFANQSLGACMAGLGLLGQEWGPDLGLWMLASSFLYITAGFFIAHG